MATTKIQLEQQIAVYEQQLSEHSDLVAELQAELSTSQQRADDLQQQIETAAPAPQQRDQLEQTVWLQTNAPDSDRRSWTQDGDMIIRFGAQYAALDKRTGQRLYGPYKNFVAYGALAQQVNELFMGDSRLARIGAYERPSTPSENGTRRSEWVLTTITVVPRVQPAAPATVAQPTAEPIAF